MPSRTCVRIVARPRDDGKGHAGRRGSLLVAPGRDVDRQVAACLSSGLVGDVFKALADRTRRAILDELIERDGQTLFELSARLATKNGMGSTRQAISQHIDVLESAGLVTTRREGRYKFHHLDTAPLREITQRWPIPEAEEAHEDQRDERHGR